MDLTVERTGDGVAIWRLNRPHRNNALGGTLFRDLLEAAKEASADKSIAAIVTSQTGPSWSVGGDMRELANVGDASLEEAWAGTALGGDKGLTFGEQVDGSPNEFGIGQWVNHFRRTPKPLIAAIDGPVAGGGLGLAMLHDIRIASTKATFTAGFTRIGLSPEMGLTWFLPRIMGMAPATEFLLGGSVLSADEALRFGLVSRVVEPGQAELEAIRQATTLARLSPDAVQSTLCLLRNSLSSSFDDQLRSEWSSMSKLFGSVYFRDAVAKLLADFSPASPTPGSSS
jgi:2-(1,2-epoxy-1,2-dihydrophenyl)acetyl-CoA isomerase